MKKVVLYLLAVGVLILGCWLSATYLFGGMAPGSVLLLSIFAALFLAGLIMAARRLSARACLIAGILALALLFLPTAVLNTIFPIIISPTFIISALMAQLLMICMALIVVALLLHSGLSLIEDNRNAGAAGGQASGAERTSASKAGWFVLALALILVAAILYTFYSFTVWDNTDDPLGYIWLIFPGMAILFATVMLLAALPGRAKPAAFLYLLLLPAMIVVSNAAQRVDFRQLTAERAQRVDRAIDRYHQRNGRYPQELRQLTPWYALSLPGPVVIYGQAWCYQAGDDYYRLGYVNREHWSDPRLIGQIYSAKGSIPDLAPMCQQEVTAIQQGQPDYPYQYWKEES